MGARVGSGAGVPHRSGTRRAADLIGNRAPAHAIAFRVPQTPVFGAKKKIKNLQLFFKKCLTLPFWNGIL